MIGLLTLGEYLLGVDLGIDQLLFREPAGAVGTLAPGRMAPASAINIFLLGCVLLLTSFRRTIPAGQWLSVLTGLIGLLPLLGYWYGATTLFGIGHYAHMALHSAGLFVLASLGVVRLHPDQGPMRVATSDTTGGWLLRRLVPFVIPSGLATPVAV